MPDAHVTVVPVFNPIKSLAAVSDALAASLRAFPPFSVRTMDAEIVTGPSTASIVLPLEESRPLHKLHARLVRDLSATIVPVPGIAFRPRVSVVNEITVDGLDQSVRFVTGWRPNYAWTVRDLDVIGFRDDIGWQSLSRVNFGRPVG